MELVPVLLADILCVAIVAGLLYSIKKLCVDEQE